MRKGLILVGNYYETDAESTFSNQLHECQREDIEILHSNKLSFYVEDGVLTCELPDGTTFTKNSPDKPRWVMNRNNARRAAFMLEQMGIPSYPSSAAIAISHDKALSQAMLAETTPSLDSMLLISSWNTEEDVSKHSGGYPYILKGVDGHSGYDVHIIDAPERRDEVMAENGYKRNKMTTQAACERGDDLRVYVLDDTIIGAVLRKVVDGEWKANYDHHPEYFQYELTDEDKDMVLSSMALFPKPLGLVSIDFLFDGDKLVLCETNTNPATDALGQIGQVDGIVERYIDYLNAQTKAEGE